jgi:23S rRNA (guanosine2251-2'-O)-methyltransferase
MPRDRDRDVSAHTGTARDAGDLVSGKRAVLEAIRSGAATEVVVASGSRRSKGMGELLSAAGRARVHVREAPREQLDALSRDHRGVVARVSSAGALTLGERELASFPFADDAVVVVLDGVEDPQNLGAAARSAEAAGVAALVTRTHRAAPLTDAALRASAGALAHLPLARVANIGRAIERLQVAGFFVVGLDERAPSTVYDDPCPPGRVAIVVGSEGSGMARLVRERCDALVALPMRGRVGSLNAAASLAAVLYAWVVPTRGPGGGG